MKGLFISGSGTNVGKTFIACHFIRLLADCYTIKVRKPIESDCLNVGGALIPRDGALLSQACLGSEPIESVCPFRFEARCSAEKASDWAGVEITLKNLADACQPTHSDDFVIVEGAGGLYSPIAKQALNVDLIAMLALPLVLVVRDELGAINQALLCVEAAKKQNLALLMIVLNQIKANDLDNAKALENYTNVPIVVFNADNLSDFDAKVRNLVLSQ